MNEDNSPCGGTLFLPVILVALALFLSLAFQTTQIIRDRDGLQQYMGEQDKPLEESHKLQVQLTALALGTKRLADGGDKNAAAIIARLQQAGITVGGSDANVVPSGSAPAQPE